VIKDEEPKMTSDEVTERKSDSLDVSSPRADCVCRAAVANTVPFFLRAWWLRDREQNAQLNFGQGTGFTLPLWSLHSDPTCDAANVDAHI
jgi:hypothetical protein